MEARVDDSSRRDGRSSILTRRPDQKPAALDGSPADAQSADYNNDEGHATDAPMGASAVKCWRPSRNLFAC